MPKSNIIKDLKNFLKGTFDWDVSQQSIVLGCFFYGYVLTQIPGGRAAEKFGGKWILGIGILITSIFTILMPIAAKTDFKLLVAVRVIEGNSSASVLHIVSHKR